MDKLKPCPFCGGEAILTGSTSTRIECGNDQCVIGSPAPFNNFSHRYDAISAWNTRIKDIAAFSRGGGGFPS